MINEFIKILKENHPEISLTYSEKIQTICDYLHLDSNSVSYFFKGDLCFIPNTRYMIENISNLETFLISTEKSNIKNYKYIRVPFKKYEKDRMFITFHEDNENTLCAIYNVEQLNKLKVFW